MQADHLQEGRRGAGEDAFSWHVIAEIPKIGLFDGTMSARIRYYRPRSHTHTHTHTHTPTHGICVQKLCSSAISKENYEFTSQPFVHLCCFCRTAFVNNFRGRLADCQVVSAI